MKRLALAFLLVGFLCNCGGGGGGTAPPPVISVSLTPSAQTAIDQGQSVSFTAAVANDSGAKGVTWSLSGTGCTGDACGTLSNTSSTAAKYNAPATVSADLTVSVKATSAADTSKSASGSVVVKPAPAITTTSLANGIVGTAYSATLQGTGGVGTLAWSLGSGSLPTGLSLSGGGAISGTPTAAGASTFTVKATDQAPTPLSATQQLTLTVESPLSVTTTSLPNGLFGAHYSAALVATGGTPPYSWSVTSGSLPLGLTLNATTGTIQGTPTTVGTSTFTVTATDSATPTPATANKQLSITITATAVCDSGHESLLSGQYAFSLGGFNGTGFLALVGSFTADGAGHFTAGQADTNGALGAQNATLDTAVSAYSVGSDNRGCATIVTSFGVFTAWFALGSISGTPATATKGRIIEFDSPSSAAYIAAGQIAKQDPTAFSAGLTGNYVFDLAGLDFSKPARVGFAGVMSASGGQITNLEEDINESGTLQHFAPGTITGTYTAFDSTGRATATFSSGGSTVSTGVLYMVSTSNLFYLQTSSNPVVAGVVEQQTGTFSASSLNLPAVFAESGRSGAGAKATIGIFTGHGDGTASVAIHEDDAGALSPKVVGCTYTVASNGRTPLSGPQCGTGVPILYLTSANTGVMLGTDTGVSTGHLEPQGAGPFTDASVSGTFFMGTDQVVEQSAEADAGSITLNAGSVTGTTAHTSTTSQNANQTITDTYSVNADGTFSLASEGTAVVGIVISGTKLVRINQPTSLEPTILVIEK